MLCVLPSMTTPSSYYICLDDAQKIHALSKSEHVTYVNSEHVSHGNSEHVSYGNSEHVSYVNSEHTTGLAKASWDLWDRI